MKKLFLFSILFFIALACDSFPQQVSVKTTYSTPTDADSCYMLIWKGTNINQNPLVEDGDYGLLNLTTLQVYKVPTGVNQSFTRIMNADGQVFKIALVPFKIKIPAPLTVSAFYTLPTPPAKATILNVEIF